MSPLPAPDGPASAAGRQEVTRGVGGEGRGDDVAARNALLQRLEAGENFPVALRILPRSTRARLQSVYDVVRVIDDLGDEWPHDRVTALEEFRSRLRTVWTDRPPGSGVLGALVPTVRDCALPIEPFEQLIEANLLDQAVTRYAGLTDLLDYCRLSAAPVGRLVLAIFGRQSPAAERLSDQICIALQIIEHCQDVGEDYRNGRIYLPLEDRQRLAVAESDLGQGESSPALRELIGFEALRARDWLKSGEPLVRMLPGWAGLAVTGYLAGGHAAVDALAHNGWAVLPEAPRPRRRDLIRHAARIRFGLGRPA